MFQKSVVNCFIVFPFLMGTAIAAPESTAPSITSIERSCTDGVTPSQLVGTWDGQYKEYDANTGKEKRSIEKITIKGTGNCITGGAESVADRRTWHHEGFYKKYLGLYILVLNYWDKDPDETSMGTIVVSGELKKSQSLRGYWVGHDRDLKFLVACPYVLRKALQNDSIEPQAKKLSDEDLDRDKKWLEKQHCHPENLIVSQYP